MWAALIPIIAKYGIEFGYQLWQNIQAGNPTEEQWQALLKMADKSYDDYLAEAKSKIKN